MAPGIATMALGAVVRFGTLEFTTTPGKRLELELTLMPYNAVRFGSLELVADCDSHITPGSAGIHPNPALGAAVLGPEPPAQAARAQNPAGVSKKKAKQLARRKRGRSRGDESSRDTERLIAAADHPARKWQDG
jgi:hypothetical protein